MARVIGNPFGELRGKIAGNVFSRNASGQIIRAYVIPANRNTQAQQESRNNFRNSAQFWKTLSQIDQQAWNDFSVSEFNPLRGVNTGQFTGHQAQVSVRAAVLNGIGQSRDATYTALNGGVDPTIVTANYVPSQKPPLKSVQANLKQMTGPPITYLLDNFIVTAAGQVSFDALFVIANGANNQDNFIDENGNPYTWKVYLSDPVSQVGGRPKNDFFNSLGSATPVTFDTLTLAGLTGVTISWGLSHLIPKMLSWPQVGEIAKMTVSVISLDGTMIRTISRYLTLT